VRIIVGVATVYAGQYVGQPLYCGGVYAETTEPWVALPYGGDWRCGDRIDLSGVDASGEPWSLKARAMDTGPFGDYCVEQPDGTCPPIVVDVPQFLAPFAGLSSRVQMVNVTAMYRDMLWVAQGAPVEVWDLLPSCDLSFPPEVKMALVSPEQLIKVK